MPSIEQKIQSYLNFSKGKSSSKEALKDIGCATAGAVAGAVAGVATLNKDVAESVSNKVNDKCRDKVESIFGDSNYKLKDDPLKKVDFNEEPSIKRYIKNSLKRGKDYVCNALDDAVNDNIKYYKRAKFDHEKAIHDSDKCNSELKLMSPSSDNYKNKSDECFRKELDVKGATDYLNHEGDNLVKSDFLHYTLCNGKDINRAKNNW